MSESPRILRAANEVEDLRSTQGVWSNETFYGMDTNFSRCSMFPTQNTLHSPFAFIPFVDAGGVSDPVSQVAGTVRVGAWRVDLAPSHLPFFGFASEGHLKLGLALSGASGALEIVKWNSGTSAYDVVTPWEVGGAPGGHYITSGDVRFDVSIPNWDSATATVDVWYWYVNGDQATKHLRATLDLTTTGCTAVDSGWIGTGGNNDHPYFSQVIFGTVPLLRANAATLAWNAAGDVNTMDVGAYNSINGVHADPTKYVGSATNGARILGKVAPLFPTRTVKVLAVQETFTGSAAVAGLKHAQIGSKSGGTEEWSGDIDLDEAFGPITRIANVNPVTSAPYTQSEINAPLQTGIKFTT